MCMVALIAEAKKFKSDTSKSLRRAWRYQRGNQNLYIEEEQTTQWPKEKVQKDKQRSTKHTYKTKDRVTRPPLKVGSELMCSGRVSSACSTSGIRRVNLVTNPVISLFPLIHNCVWSDQKWHMCMVELLAESKKFKSETSKHLRSWFCLILKD